jgi:hypothetical protein
MRQPVLLDNEEDSPDSSSLSGGCVLLDSSEVVRMKFSDAFFVPLSDPENYT